MRIGCVACFVISLLWPSQALKAQQISTVDSIMEVIDVIEKHHVRPPTRQEMVLAASRELYNRSSQWLHDLVGSNGSHWPLSPRLNALLSQAVSELKTEEEIRAFLSEAVQETKRMNASRTILEAIVHSTGVRGTVSSSSPQAQAPFQRTDNDVTEQISENRYVGIGILSSGTSPYPSATKVFPRGPAYEAGMQDNDLILTIDGTSMEGVKMPDFIKLLRGQEGVDVTLEVKQPNEATVRTMTITRAVVPQVIIEGWEETSPGKWDYLIRPDVAYIKLLEITSSTLHDLKQIEYGLEPLRQKKFGFDLILDLRHVRRANLHHTILLADALRRNGELGTIATRSHSKTYEADADCLFEHSLVHVLVDPSVTGPTQWLASSLQSDPRVNLAGNSTSEHSYMSSTLSITGGTITIPTTVLIGPDGFHLGGEAFKFPWSDKEAVGEALRSKLPIKFQPSITP